VIEYVGEVVTKEEFNSRRAAYAKNNEPHFYFLELSPHHFIDAKSKGNDSRYLKNIAYQNSVNCLKY
jgi:SET domain-containing protein